MGYKNALGAIVGIFLSCLIVSDAAAQKVIALGECLQRTLEYSRDMLIAKEGIRISEGRYIEERAAALPKLTGQAGILRLHDDLPTIPGAGQNGYEQTANANLTQALFTWGQIGAALKAARYDKAASEDQYREARQLALREAATGFYDLLLTMELEAVERENLAQKRRHAEETEKKYQMAVATDYDVLAAKVALTNAQPPLLQAENNIRLAKDRLRYYMGIEETFEVEGSLTCNSKPAESLSRVLEAAKANRPEVAYYESRVGVFKELVTVAKGGNKPRVDFKSNLGWTSFGDLQGDSPGQHWDAGVYLSFPFFDGFQTKGRVIQAQSRLSTTELEMKRLLDRIALDAREAINRVEEAVQVEKALSATTSQAERLLKMAETGYRHGVKTKLEVDDAELNLRTARSNLARARRDYLVASTRLLWVKGVDLQPALTAMECKPDGT